MSGTYSPEDSALVASLVALSAKNPKLVKSTAYGTTIDGAEVKIRSWKMNEFKYYDIPSPFPTLARGLFTRELVTDGATKYQIVVRGYDKFFNIGEVPWTAVRSFLLSFLQDVDLIYILVGISGSAYSGTLYPVSQIERMYHLYCGSDPYTACRDLQALHGCCGSVSTVAEHEPRASRRRLAQKVPRQPRKGGKGHGAGVMGQELDRHRRGMFVLLLSVPSFHLLNIAFSCATTISKNTSSVTHLKRLVCIYMG